LLSKIPATVIYTCQTSSGLIWKDQLSHDNLGAPFRIRSNITNRWVSEPTQFKRDVSGDLCVTWD